MKRAIASLLIALGVLGAMYFTSTPQLKYEPTKRSEVARETSKPKPREKKAEARKPAERPRQVAKPVPRAAPKPVAINSNIIRLVNQVRAKHGLSPLIEASDLNRSATLSAQGQANTGTCCNHGDWTKWFTQAGANYSYKAENIAACQVSDQQVVDAWVGSPPHLENILNSTYKYAGVGKVTGDFKGEFSGGKTVKCIYYANHFGA